MTAITSRRTWSARARWILYVVLFVPVSILVLELTTTLCTVGYPECDEPGDACTQEYLGWVLGSAAMAVIVVGVVIGETVSAIHRFRGRRNP